MSLVVQVVRECKLLFCAGALAGDFSSELLLEAEELLLESEEPLLDELLELESTRSVGISENVLSFVGVFLPESVLVPVADDEALLADF